MFTHRAGRCWLPSKLGDSTGSLDKTRCLAECLAWESNPVQPLMRRPAASQLAKLESPAATLTAGALPDSFGSTTRHLPNVAAVEISPAANSQCGTRTRSILRCAPIGLAAIPTHHAPSAILSR
jgi:hypothetical protein